MQPPPRPRLSIFALLSVLTTTLAQSTIFPSNSSTDLYAVATSPRFLLNGTEFPHLPVIHLAPLGEYAQILHDDFVRINARGHLANVNANNANIQGSSSLTQFSYVSCDPASYTGNLDANDVFRIVVQQNSNNVVILYSTTADHCGASALDQLPTISGILTTTNATLASMLASLNLNFESSGEALILPDLNSYVNSTDPPGSGMGSGGFGQSPTTAVAMIILYSITGIITALFVVIIVTGAIRAHRHPERYGPRNIMGRGRQSRARGIARAMLDTLPIVKFGDRTEGDGGHEQVKPAVPQTENTDRDIEMNTTPTGNTVHTETEADANSPTSRDVPLATTTLPTDHDQSSTEKAVNNADGTDDLGHLGCSICTEDFTRGEEVRVLPCNHKFHPDCVDPWLLNVSGTCPLCRIDLRPKGDGEDGTNGGTELAPPLVGAEGVGAGVGEEGRRRRDTFANLRQMANLGVGSREERIDALRRLRQERQERQQRHERNERMGRIGRQMSIGAAGGEESAAGVGQDQGSNEEEARRGLARRFRERFRIRTERNAETPTPAAS